MQLFILALVLGVATHDAMVGLLPDLPLDEKWLVVYFITPKLLIGLAYAMACRITLKRLGRRRGPRLLLRLDRLTTLYRILILVLFAADLILGVLVFTRHLVSRFLIGGGSNNPVIVDEILFLLPPLILLSWGWWVYYPIDRRLREASLIRRIDSGKPVHAIWTRSQYLVCQIRHQIALILVPLLFLMAWSELVELFMPARLQNLNMDLRPCVQLAGAMGIFLLAPVMIRHIWDTVPLPDGDLRCRLTEMCRRHHVGVRELLLWRTFGGMINAAVMGLIRPLRFILLTDGLLEQLPRAQVEAVMAHELAHIRKHHTFWLLAVALVLIISLFQTTLTITHALAHWFVVESNRFQIVGDALALLGNPDFQHAVAFGISIGCWFPLFGWVSRRLERQADTFAVQHLVAEDHEAAVEEDAPQIDAASVTIMADALQRVAQLNHIPVRRHSWRHGSIAWRQNYLRSVTGQPVDQLKINCQIGWIKAVTMAGAVVLIVLNGWSLGRV